VTTQGEQVIDLLWDVIAAKGFERDTFFEMAARDIRALPKLEGTVHVNIALIVKFMANYFFNPADLPVPDKIKTAQNDDFLFNQGPAKGLAGIRFHSYASIYAQAKQANVQVFKRQIRNLKRLLLTAKPNQQQRKDTDFLLALGELFALVVYGQLILENARIYKLSDDLLDQIFDCLVRDFSQHALNLYAKPNATRLQRSWCSRMIRKPKANEDRANRLWNNEILTHKDSYIMGA